MYLDREAVVADKWQIAYRGTLYGDNSDKRACCRDCFGDAGKNIIERFYPLRAIYVYMLLKLSFQKKKKNRGKMCLSIY